MKKPMYFEGIVAVLLILLCFAMYLMLTGTAGTSSQWQVAGSGPVDSLALGDDGTLYAFTGENGNDIYAIGSDGREKWAYQVPRQWRASTTITIPQTEWLWTSSSRGFWASTEPILASDKGTLYLYVRENKTTPADIQPFYGRSINVTNDSLIQGAVTAISPEGKLLWTAIVGTYYWPYCDVNVHVKDGRVYAFTGYNLTVLDTSGKKLFVLGNVSDPPAVDDSGYIYASRAVAHYDDEVEATDIKDPSGVIDAYYPNGTLYWSKAMNLTLSRPQLTDGVRQQYGYLPLYQNGTLYVPARNGVVALYANGSVRWSKSYGNDVYQLYSAMPIDARDNLYLQYQQNPPTYLEGPGPDAYTVYLQVIAGNGTVLRDGELSPGSVAVDRLNDYTYSQDGVSLEYPSMKPFMYNLVTSGITAYDLLNNRPLWHFTIPLGPTRQAVLDASNVRTIFHPATAELLIHDNMDMANSSFAGLSQPFVSWPQLTVLSGNNVVYVSYLTSNVQVPPVFEKASCVYTNSIYALDTNGTLLWSMPVDSFVTSMAANNSTIYYGMSNGAISVGQTGSIAGGIAIVAMLYVFFKFFLAGSVTRARKLLDKNANRNAVYDHILRNPGSTLYDISRALGMNIGTTRYHLYILGMSHRIVTHYTGVKYVRYFTNSGSYSKEEQSIISLVRRDVMRKILGLLVERPGLSNMQISQALNTPESSVSKYMKELSSGGIVMKSPMGSYSIKAEYQPLIANALGHTGMSG